MKEIVKKQSQAPEEILEEVKEAGKQALSIFDEKYKKGPDTIRLYRGSFFKFKGDEEKAIDKVTKSIAAEGLVSQATAFGINLDEVLKVDVRKEPLKKLVELHTKGFLLNFWKEGSPLTLIITPFVSLTSSSEVALGASLSVLELIKQAQLGMYVDESGMPNREYYEKLSEFYKEGRPVVYVVDVSKNDVKNLSSVSELSFEQLGERDVIFNSINPYGEEEYLARKINKEQILGFIFLKGNPLLDKDKEWRIMTLAPY